MAPADCCHQHFRSSGTTAGLLLVTLLLHDALSPAAAQVGTTEPGGGGGDRSSKWNRQQWLGPAALKDVDHDTLIHLLHRAASSPVAIAQVRAKSLTGRDFAMSSPSEARMLLNCTTGVRCFGPFWCGSGDGPLSLPGANLADPVDEAAQHRSTPNPLCACVCICVVGTAISVGLPF